MTTDVTIIGAGPYGLAISAHLSARRVRHRIVGRPMRSWSHHMPKGMFLKSEGFASNISDPRGTHTLARYCAEHGQAYEDQGLPVPLDTFVGYGQWFQQSLVPHVEQTHVEHLTRDADGFVLRLQTDERFTSRRVVVAAGNGPFPYVPDVLRGLPGDRVSHPWEHHDMSTLSGQDVTIVGVGQSGLEAAALLHELGTDVRLVARARDVRWLPPPTRPPLMARLRRPLSGLGRGPRSWFYANLPEVFRFLPDQVRTTHVRTALGPAGAWWLRERVEPYVPVVAARELVGAEPVDGGRLRVRAAGPDGAVVEWHTDHVLAATGYRVDVNRLAFLDPSLRRRLRTIERAPALDGRLESSVPGLHFAGLAAAQTFGPVCRFVYGTTFTARRLARTMQRDAAPSR